jgi:hypothetical protein
MPSSGMLCHVDLVRIDVSEEHSTSIIRVTRIGELGTMLAVPSYQRTLLMLFLAHQLSTRQWRSYVPLKHQFLQQPHGRRTMEKVRNPSNSECYIYHCHNHLDFNISYNLMFHMTEIVYIINKQCNERYTMLQKYSR